MSIVPIVRYVDGESALAFLVDGLGFEVHGDTMRGEDGAIVHAELRRGEAFLMLSDSAEPSPREIYLVEAEPDARFQQAVAAGAEVVYEPKEQSYGSREFAVKDPEGTIWYVGTYEPG